jgi:predicted dehydrogenase
VSDNLEVLLVGAGPIAMEYAKVLQSLMRPFSVIGRGAKSADAFAAKTGVAVFAGPIEEYIAEYGIPSAAIVAVSMDQLARVTTHLMELGVRNILVEKPAGLNVSEVRKLGQHTKTYQAKVFVAYNRRFYSSVLKAQEIVREDGGVSSFHFEFTEWSHTIEKLEHAPGVLENWFFANSSHVIDTAFFLGGYPAQLSCFAQGGLGWHKAAIYSGAGVSDKGALFSYHANWCAPGRWMIEFMTKKHRLIFKPLEKLQIQQIGSLTTDFVDIDDAEDTAYKPGFYRQVAAFLAREDKYLLRIDRHVANLKFYEMMNQLTPTGKD